MEIPSSISAEDTKDVHEHDLVMPGFRFHPTEEELIEFYLRRKVEGKRFNVEFINFIDLYRYDPWELPALAAGIGGKEWFFYVPRDRKYRNGDRPNRVTASGYWKATGADRMIRTENHRSIGLKKTLVFYSGKAPKGIRTSWIMNEYRLPQSETNRYQKTEISLCRVYKRAGVDDNFMLNSKPSSSKGNSTNIEKKSQTSSHQRPLGFQAIVVNQSSTSTPEKAQRSVIENNHLTFSTLPKPTLYGSTTSVASLNSTTTTELEDNTSMLHHSHNTNHATLISTFNNLFNSPSTNNSCIDHSSPSIDELNRLVGLNQCYVNNNHPSQFIQPSSQPQLLHQLSAMPISMPLPLPLTTISDKLWEWNPLSEVSRDYTTFK